MMKNCLMKQLLLKNTHKQANRIKCATLGWNGLIKLIEESEK